jgi:hypothetical protein
MPKIVYFKPLDGSGVSPVDLEACPCKWRVLPENEIGEGLRDYEEHEDRFSIYLSPQD